MHPERMVEYRFGKEKILIAVKKKTNTLGRYIVYLISLKQKSDSHCGDINKLRFID